MVAGFGLGESNACLARMRTLVLKRWIAPQPAMPGEPPTADPDPSEPESEVLPFPPLPGPPLGLDRRGLLEATAGTVIALIALFSSYDHITTFGRSLPLQQQWGVWLIAASLALVVVDAQLATRSRLREAHERTRNQDSADQERNRADRERYFAGEERKRAAEERSRADRERNRADQERSRADQERSRADQARNRAAEAAERQRQATARLHACALLGGRFQLDPSPANAARYRAFLALMAEAP
jgi:uncharacterized membrane protein